VINFGEHSARITFLLPGRQWYR